MYPYMLQNFENPAFEWVPELNYYNISYTKKLVTDK